MAKISALDLVTEADGTESLPIVKGGRAKRIALRALALMMVPFLQAYYKGDRGDAGAAGNVAIGRGTDAAGLKGGKAAAANVGDVWYLSEDGRDGPFKMRAGMPPKSDPLEGLYVIVNGTRYWERVTILMGLPGGGSHMSWWGTSTARADNDIPANEAMKLAPDGDLYLPPAGIYKHRRSLFLNRDNLRVIGRLRATCFKMELEPGNTDVAYNGIVIGARNWALDGVFLYGAPTNKTSGNAYGVCITGEVLPQGTPVENGVVTNCIIENYSVAGVVFAQPNYTKGRGLRAKNIRIHHNLMTCNVQGWAFFGSEDVIFEDNLIRWFEGVTVSNGDNTVMYGMRVVGPTRLRITNNTMIGGLRGAFRPGYAAVVISNGALGSPPAQGPQDGNYMTSRDITIEGNRFYDFYVGLYVLAARGFNVSRGNLYTCGSLTNSTPNSVAYDAGGDGGADASGIVPVIDEFLIEGDRYEGFTLALRLDGATARTAVRGSTFVANAEPNSTLVDGTSGRLPLKLDIIDNDFIGHRSAGRLVGNDPNIAVTTDGNRFGDSDAYVIVPLPGKPFGQEGAARFFNGQNYCVPAGTWQTIVSAYAFQLEQ
jgi:hypothetical protein